MPQETEKDLLSRLGIEIGAEKIDIDIGKTKAFFNGLQSTLQARADDLQRDIAEGKIDMEQSAGIKIDKEHISVDLDKTKNFIEELGRKIEGVVTEIDRSVAKFVPEENRLSEDTPEVLEKPKTDKSTSS